MMAQSWGSSAASAAGAMGVSATALAATCAMESNCQNVGSSGESSATGAFQMISSTYNADIAGAVAYDPSIAGTVVSGSAGEMDPATEAYAASYELRQDALNLQNGQYAISNPTVLDVRAVYQFGSGAGPGVAAAPDDANIAQLTGLSAASLAANGLNSSSTVGQWRQTIINKLGSATANQAFCNNRRKEMYTVRSKLALALALAFIGGWAHAEQLQPGSPLTGFQCYSIDEKVLKLTPEEAFEGKGFPPVFNGPSEDSGKVGIASGLVYVAWPLRKDNGFLQILRGNGETAWISEAVMRPLYRDPGSKGGCTLKWHGNRIQAYLDPGAKGGLFREPYDIPVRR
jgi:hypothetical protein